MTTLPAITLLENLLLLRIESRQGRGKVIEEAMNPVIAGSVLLDLALAGRIDLDHRTIFIVDPSPTGDPILDSVLGFVAAGTAGATPREWVTATAGLGPHLKCRALERLEARGLIEREGEWVRMDGPEAKLALTAHAPLEELRSTLRTLLLGDDIPDPREVVMVCLADASEVLDAVLSFKELTAAAPRIRRIARMELMGQAISGAVQEVRAVLLGEEELRLSMSVLVHSSSLLGQKLEDRNAIRRRQDGELVLRMQKASSTYVGDLPGHEGFFVAPMDVLVYEDKGNKHFQMIELNGTGIGGLTNISDWAVRSILTQFRRFSAKLSAPRPLIVVANSTKAGGPNPMIYENILYSDALVAGLEEKGVPARLVPLDDFVKAPEAHADHAVVVLGYMDAFMQALSVEDGRLTLCDRPVAGAINDRFAHNAGTAFGTEVVDRPDFFVCNFCYKAGADKAIAYELANAFMDGERNGGHAFRFIKERILFTLVDTPEELNRSVRRFIDEGISAVIKPNGTGHGHGIEFFFPGDDEETIDGRIAASFASIRNNYGGEIDGFPYTVCEFIDTATIARPDHPHFGHKYEIRVVVYRDGEMIKAFPSIAKVSSQRYDPQALDRLMLINNVTTSSAATKAKGADFVLPLSNPETMELFGITEEQLTELCGFATAYVRHVIASEYHG